jgi:hypothetical protein
MARTVTQKTLMKRLDTIIALPLERFRRALTRLPAADLAALESRMALHAVRSRWQRGGHGIARHRAPNELGRLERRQTALRQERAARLAAAPEPITLPLVMAETVEELAA